MGSKYTVTEVSCNYNYGCIPEYEVHLHANGDIGSNIMSVKSDIENIEYVKWPTITVTTNGFKEMDIANQIAIVTGRGSEKTRYFQDWILNQYLWTRPTKVIFHDPATIVFWNDGTKTVVKCQPGDIYSKEMGLALCFSKKMLGNKSNFNNEFKKWIPEE